MTKKLLCVLLVLLLALTAMTAVACDNTDEQLVGIEACEYYLESGSTSYELSIGADNTFTFKAGSTTLAGGYLVTSDTGLVLTAEDGTTLTLTMGEDTATLVYNNQTYTLYLKTNYTVSFDMDGGSATASQTVVNGGSATAPADPTKEGYKFLGWYTTDAYTTLFDFDGAITANTTVYANFVEIVGSEEFVITYGYGDFDATTTTNGKLYAIDIETPEANDGAAFLGWWISMDNDADKLSYPWTEDVVFTENTTLYPLWEVATTGNKIEQQIITLTEDGFDWNGSTTAVGGYLVEVTGPSGFTAISTTVTTNTYALDWAELDEGNYTVSVTALAATEANNSDTATVYYTNKALARVSYFEIEDQFTLKFNTVDNATEYFITVECNDTTHASHTNLSLGNTNTYDFSACDMPIDGSGITFTITAVADGYASSTATYVLYRELEQATALDVTDELLTWEAVEYATGYTLTVTYDDGAETALQVNLTADTLKYDLRYLGANNYTVTLTATAKGYYNGDAATTTFDKTTLATPDKADIVGTNIEWTAVDGAESYELTIDGEEYTATTNYLAWPIDLEAKEEAY